MKTLAAALLSGCVCFAVSLAPQPACAPGALSAYLALPAQGCTIADNVTVYGFDFQVQSGVPISAADIQVTPVFVPNMVWGLLFTPQNFAVSGSDSSVWRIDYVFDPTDIRSIRDVLSASSPVAPGFVNVDTFLCKGSAFSPTCPTAPVLLNVFDNGFVLSSPDLAVISPPQNVVGVRHIITLDAQGASADFDSLENAIVAIPEPHSWILLTTGLCALAVRRRR